MPVLIVIDNYDSFVHNLARFCNELGQETRVLRNDAVTPVEVLAMRPAAVIVSPGPQTPAEAGVSEELIRQCTGRVPLLGVCLGHQAISSAFGGRIVRAPRPVHGQTSVIRHDGSVLFKGLPPTLSVMRYHSLIVDEQTLPPGFCVTARTEDGIPMAIAHHSEPVFGVQFHPESILTDSGHAMLRNFLSVTGADSEPIPKCELRANVDLGLWARPIDVTARAGVS